MSIRVGITGGIGSGKSVVSRLLAIMGVPVYLTDDRAKQLTGEDLFVRRKLTALVGKEVYAPDGTLNRSVLAAYLFADEAHARKVNALIHPRVKEDFLRWADERKGCPVVAVESALLWEAGFADCVDHIVMVYAPEALRMERAMQRDHAAEEAVRRRMRCQMDDEVKRRAAHTVLLNDGATPLLPQVWDLMQKLLAGTALRRNG